MADGKGIQQDGFHKSSIATQIEEYIDSIIGVLFLTNGAVPYVTVGIDYALSTLSATFPKSLARNTAFMSRTPSNGTSPWTLPDVQPNKTPNKTQNPN